MCITVRDPKYRSRLRPVSKQSSNYKFISYEGKSMIRDVDKFFNRRELGGLEESSYRFLRPYKIFQPGNCVDSQVFSPAPCYYLNPRMIKISNKPVILAAKMR